ncbi:MAG: radical SAM protein [Planctomycetota bacterium]
MSPLRDAFANHSRRWRSFHYVYPVIARRSRGLSLGINLNPDQVCSFNCIYCCVDRAGGRPAGGRVNLSLLESELRALGHAYEALFDEPEFAQVPPDYRRLNDIAFSGDGEPTLVPTFPQAVRIAAGVRRECRLDAAQIVLITNACALTRPPVAEALTVLDRNNGEIWAKLDAGTEEHFRLVSRSKCMLEQVLANILAAARVRPIVIQTLFMRIHNEPPPTAEINAYIQRLRELLRAGAQLKSIQVYTVARRTAVPWVAPLAAADLERVAAAVRPLGVTVNIFP